MASPFMDVLEKMLDENEDDHHNILSDDEQNMDEDQSGDAGNVLMAVIKTTGTLCNQTLFFQKYHMIQKRNATKVRFCTGSTNVELSTTELKNWVIQEYF